MIDKSLKAKFIETEFKPESRQSMMSILNNIGKIEDEYGMDFSLFDQERLNYAISSISCIKNHSNETILYLLRKYVAWRRNNGFECNDNILTVEVDNSSKIKSMMVSSPTNMLSILDNVFKITNDFDVNYIYRAYLWFAYLGMRESEAIHLITDDIDIDNMRVLGKYRIYQEALVDIKRAVDIPYFFENKTLRGEKTIRKMERDIGDRVLRGRFSFKRKTPEEILRSTIRPTITRRFKQSEYNLSYERIRQSGIFFIVYDKNHDNDSVIAIEDSLKFLNQKQIVNSNFLSEYRKWKDAFYK